MLKRTVARQICPICRTQQPIDATRCINCGAALLGLPLTAAPTQVRLARVAGVPSAPPAADWDDGDADLYEGSLPALPLSGLFVLLVTIGVIAGLLLIVARRANDTPANPALTRATQPLPQILPAVSPTVLSPGGLSPTLSSTTIVTVAALNVTPTPQNVALLATETLSNATAPPTNTRPPTLTATNTQAVLPPTLALSTVTPVPPSPTITATRGPCNQKAKAGDTLSALAARCGQYGQAIIQTILDANGLKDAGQLQVGQVITIPWPTAAGAAAAKVPAGSGTPNALSLANAEPTLSPGQLWYTIKKGDNAIIIAYKFHTSIKVLHDLNPEIAGDFSQCDYGQDAGGQTCSVRVSEGERIRVPVPLPTPTRTPTPNGSETATPTITATYNAPTSLSPSDNMLFNGADFPVLRWTESDKLGPNQVYLVTVTDLTIKKLYRASTTDLAFQLPPDWQPNDGTRHQFEWFVSVAIENGSVFPQETSDRTEKRTFVWLAASSAVN